jgi:hypothetical protein
MQVDAAVMVDAASYMLYAPSFPYPAVFIVICGAHMKKPDSGKLSRREFARSMTIAAVVAGIPAEIGAQEQKPPTTPAPPKPAAPNPAEGEPKLSPAARAEAEAKIQNIFRKYGDRLNEEQKADVRKSMLSTQDGVEKLRAFSLENWDEPVTIFRPLTGKEA